MSKTVLVTINYQYVVVPIEVLPYIDKFEIVSREHTKDYRTVYYIREPKADLTVNFVDPSTIRDEKLVEDDPVAPTPSADSTTAVSTSAPLFNASTDKPATVHLPDTREFVDEYREAQ